jgi:MFS family permease
MFVAALDQTIVATAIPTIAAKLHSASGYTWIGGAYLLANAAGACIWAKLSDIWGRKLILLIAVAWFFVSSIICAVAVNMQMLIAGRALQGVAGGGLLQLVTIVISDLFSVRYVEIFPLSPCLFCADTSTGIAVFILDSWNACGHWPVESVHSWEVLSPSMSPGDGTSGSIFQFLDLHSFCFSSS